jgi:hypothetical protein
MDKNEHVPTLIIIMMKRKKGVVSNNNYYSKHPLNPIPITDSLPATWKNEDGIASPYNVIKFLPE